MSQQLFRVWQEGESEESAVEVLERDDEDAAERWAQEYDAEGDYTIVQGATKTVHVRAANGDGTIATFDVHGEAEPSYYATRKP